MKMSTKQKYRSYSQYELKNLSDKICDNIEMILSKIGIEQFKYSPKMISMSCPIHGGDNESAVNIYHTGDHYRGNWKCRTHHCDSTFKASIIGFIRGVLSKQKFNWSCEGDKVLSFNETIDIILSIIDDPDYSCTNQNEPNREKQDFVKTVKYIQPEKIEHNNKIPKEICKKLLSIPSNYFSSRGFSKDVLKRFDVGECNRNNKEMSDRAVVPVYDIDNQYVIGSSGRSIFEKCSSCSCYHNPNNDCPTKENQWLYPKWKHSSQFKSNECLYNLWNAQKYIKLFRTLVLVESPGNVWKLEESGIHNSVALFGSNLSDKQKMLIDISGAMKIVVIMDNDDPGKKAAEQIIAKCNKTYNIENIDLSLLDLPQSYNDIAEMNTKDIIDHIKPIIGIYE